MLIMVEKCIRGRICYFTVFIDMQKLIISIWKIMIRITNRCILNIGIQRIYMADNFESTKDAFPFNEDFIKS